MDLDNRFLKTLSKYNMIKAGEKIIVGVSGGPDSVCLLYLFYKLQKQLDISLEVAHLDHMFRGKESREDALFVKNLCIQWNIPFHEKRVNVPKYIEKTGLSPEDAARRARYAFYLAVKKETGAHKVATGHNRDDHEETVLMNILRGSGLEGLVGIDPVRDFYIRPLIEISRKDIEEYLENNNIPFRIDSTNLEPEYFRNRLRLELIPLIQKKYCPHLGLSLRRLSEIARRDLSFIDEETHKAFEKGVKIKDKRAYIDINKFIFLPEAIQYRLLRLVVEHLSGDTKDFEYRHGDLLSRFIKTASVGSWIDLPKGLAGEKRYNSFIIHREPFKEVSDYYYTLDVPGQLFIGESEITIYAYTKRRDSLLIKDTNSLIALLDYDKIKANLIVRNRRPGDKFVPLGSKNFKKVKDFFIDEKIPRRLRNNIPIIEANNKIIWIGGMRIDDRFKITAETKDILVLKMEQEDCSC